MWLGSARHGAARVGMAQRGTVGAAWRGTARHSLERSVEHPESAAELPRCQRDVGGRSSPLAEAERLCPRPGAPGKHTFAPGKHTWVVYEVFFL